MRSKAIWAFLLAVLGVTVYAANVLATPASGFTGTTIAKATYGEIYSHVHTVPAYWSEKIQTKGDSDLYVQQNTWQPGGSTGWHTHPGPSFIIVTEGSITAYEGDDHGCTARVYTAGTANNAFVDPGDGHVHILRNETNATARTVAVQFVPAGAVRRQDEPDPGNCAF
jgi:quercetin dioxygenase-like cupin family protein